MHMLCYTFFMKTKMKVTKDIYAKMNAAYNTLYDEWQNIEGMPAEVDKQLNMSLVLLDGVLDKLKEAMIETENAESSGAEVKEAKTSGFKIFGGK